MTSDVVLSAALRSNLLSLQNTQSVIDSTQLRLSTGKKVNSALDNPQSYFAAQALTNRANDLTRLLDGIGQSIQVIKAADNGVTALTKLVEQAQSVAQSAQDAIATAQAEAKVVGDRDLRGVTSLTAVSGITAADRLVVTVTDSDGQAINIGTYGNAAGATANIAISANQSIEELIGAINDLRFQVNGAGNAVGEQASSASLDESGHLVLKTLHGENFNINFQNTTANGQPNNDTSNLALASALGFGSVARIVRDGGANAANNVEFTAIADNALRSFQLAYTSGGTEHTAQRGTILTSLHSTTATGTALFTNINSANDVYTVSVNGGTAQTIALFQNGGAITVQEFIDGINNNTSLNTKILADFDDTTGQVTIEAIDGSVKSIEIGMQDNNELGQAHFGFGLTTIASTATDPNGESIRFAAAAGSVSQFETDFNSIRDQIDALVTNGDTGYRGTNLLNGDDLLTVFNEDRTSSLTTTGTTFTADGLGIDEADFGRSASVQTTLDQINDALESLRSFGSSLSNSLAVIQTRQEFTSSLITNLKAGADLLTVADQNEEGAKLLALQTRQQLGVTALSLASQSQQSILRLF